MTFPAPRKDAEPDAERDEFVRAMDELFRNARPRTKEALIGAARALKRDVGGTLRIVIACNSLKRAVTEADFRTEKVRRRWGNTDRPNG